MLSPTLPEDEEYNSERPVEGAIGRWPDMVGKKIYEVGVRLEMLSLAKLGRGCRGSKEVDRRLVKDRRRGTRSGHASISDQTGSILFFFSTFSYNSA